MNNVIKIIFFGFFIIISSAAFPAEREDICIKYKKDYGWSNGYSVQGTVMSGSDLNSAVSSLTRFKIFSTYVVVFWDEGEASIFEMPSISLGSVPMLEQEVEDQYGRKWKIKKGHFLCY